MDHNSNYHPVKSVGKQGSRKYSIPKLTRDLDKKSIIVTPASTD